jgi:hypothetical protein
MGKLCLPVGTQSEYEVRRGGMGKLCLPVFAMETVSDSEYYSGESTMQNSQPIFGNGGRSPASMANS